MSCGTAARSGAVTAPRHSRASGCRGTRVAGTPWQRPEQGESPLARRSPLPSRDFHSPQPEEDGFGAGGMELGSDASPRLCSVLGMPGVRGSCSPDKPSRAMCCPPRARVSWRGDPAVGTGPWGSPELPLLWNLPAQRCQPGHLTQAPSWHLEVETQSPKKEKGRQEAAVLPPPWAVICEGTGRKGLSGWTTLKSMYPN